MTSPSPMLHGLPADFTHAQDFINPLIDVAIRLGVSDIHLERQHDHGIVRVRLDGMMREWGRLPIQKMDLIVSRIKFISGVDPMLKGVLQQGRFTHKSAKGKDFDMRLSVLPTPAMEDTVIRLLASAPEVMKLDEMGLPAAIIAGLRAVVHQDNGLILVTGPTGSGKTTTLYAAVEEIKDGSRKIITVEDPIEYQVDGLTQLKLVRERGLSYGQILKTILRHDPDVILLGEIRDVEAAEIAVEASMTGHLVLSTLHTNSAVATILRLINMGIPPIDVANSLTAVYAQRLLRTLCPHCKKPMATPDHLTSHFGKKAAPKQVFAPVGCDACDGTGFKGRTPIGELLILTDDFRDVILRDPTLNGLTTAARAAGLASMLSNGLERVAAGDADWREVFSAVGVVP